MFVFIGSKAAPETAISSYVNFVKMDVPEHPVLSLSDAPNQQPLNRYTFNLHLQIIFCLLKLYCSNYLK